MKLKKDSTITLVELPPTQNGTLNGELSYDVYSKFRLPRALPRLAAILTATGFINVDTFAPQFHGNSPDRYQRVYDSDFVGISTLTRTLNQSFELADMIRRKNPTAHITFGGPGVFASPVTEEALRHGDTVVIGEGFRTLPDLATRLTQDQNNLSGIDGLAFTDKGEVIRTKRRVLITEDELSRLPPPHYDAAVIARTTTSPIEQSIGCLFDCSFCLVTKIYERKLRHPGVETTIKEMWRFRKIGMPHRIMFIGDNFASDVDYAIDLCTAISDAGLYEDGRIFQISAHSVRHKRSNELLQALRNAGFKRPCIGFESINNSTLRGAKKPATAELNIEAARKFREFGFGVHGMFVAGLEEDTPESLRATTEFAMDNVETAQFFIATPLPGTPDYERLNREKRILFQGGEDWSLYDGQHCVIQPKNFSPYELQTAVNRQYGKFYSPLQMARRFIKSPTPTSSLGLAAYILTHGLGIITDDPQSRAHLVNLRKLS